MLGVIGIIIIIGGGYWGYKKFGNTATENRYIVATTGKNTIVVSITGSGQVSASNQVDLKPKVSGDVVYIGVINGQEIGAGALIAQLDDRNAKKTVRDAKVNLESAQLQLEKLSGPEGLAIPKNKKQAEDDLKAAYEDGFNTVANAFLDLPSIISGTHDTLYGENFSKGQWNGDYFSYAAKNYDEKIMQFRDDAYIKYQEARKNYDQAFGDYKAANRSSDENTIEALINESYNTTRAVAESVKSANNLIQFYVDKFAEKNLKPDTLATTFLSSLNGFTGKTNTHLLNLSNIRNTVKNDKDAILNADLDITSQKLTIKQRENSLRDAEEALADYYIRAPFNGIVAQLQLEKGDSISPATIIGTFITKQKLAEISLNEVDVAKIEIDQKATLTFDAIPELTISGQVAEIDAIGTVSQGVVTYKIKIAFDTQDERVKTAMSISAAIITNIKQNVLLIPISAVKSQSNTHYAEIIEGEDAVTASTANGNGIVLKNTPRKQTVEVGLSNDESTEIINGLKEGDIIAVRTISNSVKAPTTQPTSGLRIPGLGGGGGR